MTRASRWSTSLLGKRTAPGGTRRPSGRQACTGPKPFAISMEEGQSLVELADRLGCKLAVNVNGRWAPPWLGVTRLLTAGLLGRPFAVTHVYDVSFVWIRGTHFDEMEHFGLYDYSVHWVDIGLRWLRPALPVTVTAVDYRLESQPDDSHTPWGLDIYITMSDSSTIVIRGIGGSPTQTEATPSWSTALGAWHVVRNCGLTNCIFNEKGPSLRSPSPAAGSPTASQVRWGRCYEPLSKEASQQQRARRLGHAGRCARRRRVVREAGNARPAFNERRARRLAVNSGRIRASLAFSSQHVITKPKGPKRYEARHLL